MRFLFKTTYLQDIRLVKHGGQAFWYGLLVLALVASLLGVVVVELGLRAVSFSERIGSAPTGLWK